MAVKEWTTNYPSSQDTGTGGSDQQPDLVNTQDDTRVSQLHTMRNKLQSIAQKVGDNNNLPGGCLGARMTAVENLEAPRMTLMRRFGEGSEVPLDYLPIPVGEGGPTKAVQAYAVKDSNAPFTMVRFIFSSYITTEYSDTYNVVLKFGTTEYVFSGLSNTTEVLQKYDMNVSSEPSDTMLEVSVSVQPAGGTVYLGACEAHALMPWV
jgi:hypothetical protein